MTKWNRALFLAAGIASAQQLPSPAKFRTGTELVQVSVVAQDKNGKAVADLRREHFQIFDNGSRQKIALFLPAKPAPEREAATPAGVFTNRIATDARTGYSVLLFDNLDVDKAMDVFTYTVLARQKALKALMAIPTGDKIAIYSLWCQFQVLREFSSDRASLLQQLEKFAPAPGNCVDGGNGPDHALTEREFNPRLATAPVPDNAAAIVSKTQIDIADEEMKQLAEHLAGIPGRKNLIWLTSTFRVKPSNLQKLLNANVAVYPVDTVGSTIGLPQEKKARYAPINALAAITGGIAYVDRDDLDVAIGEALNDGHISYTLGFYRLDENQNAAIHRIEVRTSHERVVLRYGTRYTVEPPRLLSGNPVADLVQAMNRPVDATAIVITAKAARVQDRLDLSVSFDVSGLDLELREGLWKGKAELITRFMTADGVQAGDVISQTVTFNLRPATYSSMLQSGVPYNRKMKIPAKGVELKLLVANLATGKIGTLTIPLPKKERISANAK